MNYLEAKIFLFSFFYVEKLREWIWLFVLPTMAPVCSLASVLLSVPLHRERISVVER